MCVYSNMLMKFFIITSFRALFLFFTNEATGATNNINLCTNIYSFIEGSNCSCQSFPYACECHNLPGGCRRISGVVPQCYTDEERCDSYNYCGDWSDEKNCSCTDEQFECACHKSVSGCQHDGSFIPRCLKKTSLCDLINDCGDWSDEFNCSCPLGEAPCDCFYNDKGCQDQDNFPLCYLDSTRCDGKNYCGDWSDEKNCTYDYECDCHQNDKPCAVESNGFYQREAKCDGYNDCGDWSDELNCSCNTFRCACNNSGPGTVDGCLYQDRTIYRCYYSEWKCDNYNHCGDWSDEMNCSKCPQNRFECDSPCQGKNCPPVDLEIPNCYYPYDQCDGFNRCTDWSDEKNCTCLNNQVKCGCLGQNINCTSNLGCLSNYQILDGAINCADTSDESCEFRKIFLYGFVWLCRNFSAYEKFVTLRQLSLLTQPICHNVTTYSLTGGQNHEWWCHRIDTKPGVKFWDTAQCDNGQFIEGIAFCGGITKCTDGSDQRRNVPGFKCKAKVIYKQKTESCVLPQINLYNSLTYCADDSDNCFTDGKLKCFKCLDGKLLISPNQVCDGIVDCYDLSDECLCSDQEVFIQYL
uniref:sortilin-related receptor-like n=1 Tax=Ciona intestinalis TaxID=7719 RepID=UPI000EF48F09|nr:sortilin-related receptor-like [Ciona intestinalis]|eukprot:XP_018671019.2 sortilin-related receptor-like [Ciona intestinalis]